MDLKGRDFLTLKDYTPEEILYLIDLAAELKDKKTIQHRCSQICLQSRKSLAD